MKQIVIIVLIALVLSLGSGAIPASAADSSTAPCSAQIQSLFIDTYSASLSISGGTAHVYAKATDTNGKASLIRGTVYLQKNSNNKWSNVTSWSGSTNGKTLTISKTKKIAKGRYRVKFVVTALKGGKSETLTLYSSVKTYK